MPLADTEFIRVDKEACHPFRQRAGCSHCAAICPVDVISFDGNAPQASEGCIGCGRCAPACPVGAIDVRGFGEVADGTCHGNAIILECQRVPADRASPKAIRVPCLGGLTASHVLALRLAADCSPVTIMVHGWCESCPAGIGEAMPAAKALSDASELMEGIGLPSAFLPRVQRASLPPALRDDGAARGGLSRRGLFRRLGGGRSDASIRTPARIGADEAAPVVQGHLRRMSLLRRLSEKHGGAKVDRLLPRLRVSRDCSGHGACAGHCPSRALRQWNGEASDGLSFDSRLCVSCGLCISACPEKALSFAPKFSNPPSPIRSVIASHATGRCRHCAAESADLDENLHCPRCRNGLGMFRTLISLEASEQKERECHEHA